MRFDSERESTEPCSSKPDQKGDPEEASLTTPATCLTFKPQLCENKIMHHVALLWSEMHLVTGSESDWYDHIEKKKQQEIKNTNSLGCISENSCR